MKRKSKILCVALPVLICLVGAYVWRFVDINRQYPDPILNGAEMGEALQFGIFELKALDFQIKTAEQVAQEENCDVRDLKNSADCEMKVLSVTLQVKNTGTETAKFNVTPYRIESLDWSNGYSLSTAQWFYDLPELACELDPQEVQDMLLVFDAYDFQFHSSEWENFNGREFDLVFSTYPTKNYIRLQ